MTVLDYDRSQKTCPSCGGKRLIFIVDAPALWPVGDTIRYRCKPCAIAEAAAAGDPLEVAVHRQKKALQTAWKTGETSPKHRYALRQVGMTEDRAVSTLPLQVVRRVAWHYCDECGADAPEPVSECRRPFSEEGHSSWHYLCDRHVEAALSKR